jgi:hypothetical protein
MFENVGDVCFKINYLLEISLYNIKNIFSCQVRLLSHLKLILYISLWQTEVLEIPFFWFPAKETGLILW